MKVEFKRVTLDDRDMIERLCHLEESRSCENNFANMYLWGHSYPLEYAVIDEMLVLKSVGEKIQWRFPIGRHESLKKAVDFMMEYTKDAQQPFSMWGASIQQFERLEKEFPGVFQIQYDDAMADYIYEREKLATLSGKKLHAKRNHVNRFMRDYPDWSYETITKENLQECYDMAMQWRQINACDMEEEEEMRAEFCVTLRCLKEIEELGLRGGLLRVGGKVCGFSLGEGQSSDTFVVHVEKALDEYEGAYSMINQQFVLHETEGFMYVNREDDSDDEGLRKAKRSYHPVMMAEKGLVTFIQ